MKIADARKKRCKAKTIESFYRSRTKYRAPDAGKKGNLLLCFLFSIHCRLKISPGNRYYHSKNSLPLINGSVGALQAPRADACKERNKKSKETRAAGLLCRVLLPTRCDRKWLLVRPVPSCLHRHGTATTPPCR